MSALPASKGRTSQMPGAADMAGRRDYPESSRPLDQSEPPSDAGRPVTDQRTGRGDPDRRADQPVDHSLARLQSRLDNLPDGHPSSPRDEDGSWRAPAVSLKDLELPIEDTPNDTEAPPGTADQPQPSDATSDAWRKEVPALRAAWESHLERWPETDRP